MKAFLKIAGLVIITLFLIALFGYTGYSNIKTSGQRAMTTVKDKNIEQENLQKEILNFSGESENWKGTYTSEFVDTSQKDKNDKTSDDVSYNEKFMLKYKGPDLGSIEQIRYQYKSNFMSGGGDCRLSKDGMLTIQGGGSGARIIRTDDVITVSVEWNGKNETLEMVNKPK